MSLNVNCTQSGYQTKNGYIACMNYEVLPLFPAPLAAFNLGRSFTDDELSCMLWLLDHTISNAGNNNTQDRFVLEHEELADIKGFCQQAVASFGSDVMQVQDGNPRITQSWLNISTSGEWHHEHYHANSLWSGVLFVQTGSNDVTMFHRPDYWLGSFSLNQQSFNPYNSDTWSIPNRDGTLLLFPSNLRHSVPKTASERRITLAFNTFPTTSIGTISNLTHLNLC